MGRNKKRRSLIRKEKRKTELQEQYKVEVKKNKKNPVMFKTKITPRYV